MTQLRHDLGLACVLVWPLGLGYLSVFFVLSCLGAATYFCFIALRPLRARAKLEL